MEQAMSGELPMNSVRRSLGSRIRRAAVVVLAAWCCFWWGFAFGTHSAQSAELRALSSRLKLWEAIQNERPSSTPVRLYELDQARLSNIQDMVDVPVLYFVLAPVFSPYAAYELRRIAGAYGVPTSGR